ncbi:MAG: radical SAM family heme chaperone HemW [Oscillospiraceae bacterium]|nr:radical SAM family heme chaperone HemW [Oscillospiraceae bacterium]
MNMNTNGSHNEKTLGLYIHIPFCITKCKYCRFYSVKYSKITADSYKSAVIRNVRELIRQGLLFDTVFFGGGTPSLLHNEIAEIITILPRTNDAEITIEVNPDDVNPQMLKTLLRAGVNRISIGVQSLDNAILQNIGRRHNAEAALCAIKTAYECGFLSISADIMLGIPGQTFPHVERELDTITALPGITHISAYIYENEVTLDDDDVAALYINVARFLERKGFAQYEISNFGHPCRHNLKYWRCEEYIGLGAAAHGYFNGKRVAVKGDTDAFINAPIQNTYTTEDNPGTFEERIMLGLRLSEGIELHKLSIDERTLLTQRAKTLSAEYITLNEKSLSLTQKGFLVSNLIIGELLGDS